MENNIKMLRIIPFSELYLWDVVRYNKTNEIKSKYKLVLLKMILKQESNYKAIEIDKEYKLCGLSAYGNGLFHREVKQGKEIKGKKLNRIETGQFIYSRLGANNGAFDLVTDNYDNYWVTNEFPVFKIDSIVNPEYLKVVFRIKKYWNSVSRQLQGAAHKRFKENLFLDLKIPLPSIKEQNRIVTNYNKKIALAEQQEIQAKQLEKDIEDYLFEVLGIEKLEEKEIKKGLQFVWVHNILSQNTYLCKYLAIPRFFSFSAFRRILKN